MFAFYVLVPCALVRKKQQTLLTFEISEPIKSHCPYKRDKNEARRGNNFVVPRCRLSMGQREFYFRGPKEWNGLPDNIKNTKDIDSFKRRLFNKIFHTK